MRFNYTLQFASKIYYNILCLFILSSRFTYIRGLYWPLAPLSENISSPQDVIRVSINLPYNYISENREIEPSIKKAGSGVLVGFQTAQRIGLLPPGVYFNLTFQDSGCNSTYGTKSFIESVVSGVDVMFGPSCEYSLASVGRLLQFYNLSLLTAGGFSPEFTSNKSDLFDEFYLMTRTGYSFRTIVEGIFDFFQINGWNRTILAYHKTHHIDLSGPNTCSLFMAAMVKVANERKIFYTEIKLEETDKRHQGNQTAMLKNNINDFAVVVLCASPKKVRDILLAAEGLGLLDLGEYVFFNVELFTRNEKSSLYRPWNDKEASEEENLRAKHAYEALLTVTAHTADTNEYHNFAKDVKSLSKKLFNYSYEEPVTPLVANFHDAVLLYTTALKEVIEEHGLEKKGDGRLIVQKMWNRTITGVTGNVSINNNGDRNADYALLDMDPKTGEFIVVAVYQGLNNAFKMVPNTKIYWPHRDGPPPDKPVCGYDGSLCKEGANKVIIVITSIFVFIVLILFFLAALSFWYYRKEADLASMTWKIHPNDLLSYQEDPESRWKQGSRLSLGINTIDSTNQFSHFRTFKYKGVVVAAKMIDHQSITLTRELLVELKRMKDLHHNHLVRFIGACIEPNLSCLLTEFCPRGSLLDFLEAKNHNLDENFQYSLIHDVVKGMHFIHNCEIKVHGNLKSSNCVVDSRCTVKITDFGLHSLRIDSLEQVDNAQYYWEKLLWTAPEILRKEDGSKYPLYNYQQFSGGMPISQGGFHHLNHHTHNSKKKFLGTQRGDVYSFAIIAHEIVMRKGPFGIWYRNIDCKEMSLLASSKLLFVGISSHHYCQHPCF
nr:atrial natriuretic peptide receptor 1-like [Lepeophtheirus salmonis]